MLRHRLLLAASAAVALLGTLVLLLTALGLGHADVRGVVLRGPLRLLFLAGLLVAVLGAATAHVGLRRRRPWAVIVLAAVGPAFALTCLALDRLSPAPGAGRPLAFYLLGVGLLPAAMVLLLGRARPVRGTA